MTKKKQTGGAISNLLSPEDASSDVNPSTNLINTVVNSEEKTEWTPNNTSFAPRGFTSKNKAKDLEQYAPYIKNVDGTLRPFSILDDVQDLRGYGQSTGEKLLHGIPKFVTRVGTTVLGGTIGLLYGGGSFIEGLVTGDGWTKSANSFFDNDFQRGLDGINEYMDGALPHYYTKEERDEGFFASLNNANFWTNDFSQGLSFVVGAVLTEGLASGFMGSANVARAKNLFSNVSKSSRLSSGKSFLHPGTSIPKGRTAFNSLLDKKKWGAFGTTLRQLGTGAMYESGVEARHHKDETVAKLVQMYRDANDNKMPSKDEMAKIDEYATLSANSVFAGNVALVGYGNYMMFPKIFGKGFNGTKRTLRGTIKESLREVKNRIPLVGKDYQALYKAIGKKRAFTNAAWRILKVPMYEGFVEEGGQKLLDLSGQGAAEYWYRRKNDPEMLGMTAELINHMDDKFSEAYGSPEGSKEIGIGFMLGFLGLPGYRTVKTTEGKTKKEWGIGGVWDQVRGMRKERKMIDALEVSLKENPHAVDALKSLTDRMVRAGVIQDASDFAQIIENPYMWKNEEHDNIFTYTINRLQAGLEESILNDIDDIRNMSLAEFRETFKYNDLNDLTDIQLKEKQSELVDMMDERVSTIKQTYDKVNGSFLNYSEDQKLAITHALSVSENSQAREDAIYDKLKDILGVDELFAEEQVESRSIREQRDQEQTVSRLRNLWRRMTPKQKEDVLALPEAKYMMQQKNISEFTGEDLQQLLYGLIQERKGIEEEIQSLYEEQSNPPQKSEKNIEGDEIGGSSTSNTKAGKLESLEDKYEKIKKKTEDLVDAITKGLDPELNEAENKLIQEYAEKDPTAYSLNKEDIQQMFKDAKKLRARRHRALSMYNELLDYRDEVKQSWKYLGFGKAKQGKRKTPPKMLGMEIIDENSRIAQNAEELADPDLQRLFTKYQGRIVEFEYTMYDPTTKEGLLGLAKSKGLTELVMSDVEKILKRRPELDEITAIKTALQLRNVDVAPQGTTSTYRFYVQPEKAVSGTEHLLIAYPRRETLELLLRKKALEKLGENETAKKELIELNKILKTREHRTSYQTEELRFLKGARNIKVIDQAHQISEVLDISIESAKQEINNDIASLDKQIEDTIEEIGKISQELLTTTSENINAKGKEVLAKRIYNISRQEASLREGLDSLEIKKQEAVDKLEILNRLISEVRTATNPEQVQEKITEFLQENWKDTRQILEEHLNKGFFQSAAYSYPDMNIFAPAFENETDKEKLMELAAMVLDFSVNLQELPEELIGLLDKGTADIKNKLDLLIPILNKTKKLLHFKTPKENQKGLFGDIYNTNYDLRFSKATEKERRAEYEALLVEYYKLKEEYNNAVEQLREKVNVRLSPLFDEINNNPNLDSRITLVSNLFVDRFNDVNELLKQLTTPDTMPVDQLDSHPGVSENEFDSSRSQMDDVSFDKSLDSNNVSESKPKIYYNSPALIHIGVGKTAGNHYQARKEYNRLKEESEKRKLTIDEQNLLEAYRSQSVFFNFTSRSGKDSSQFKFDNYRLRPTTRFTLEEEYHDEVYFYDHNRSSETAPKYSTLSYKGKPSKFKKAKLRNESKETILLMVVDHEGIPVRHEGHLVYTSMMGTNPWVTKIDSQGTTHNVYRYGRADLKKTGTEEEIPSVTINGKLFFKGEMKDESKKILRDHKIFRDKLLSSSEFKYLKIQSKSFGKQILPLGVWYNKDGETAAYKGKARNTIVTREQDVQDIDLRISNNAETNKISIGAKEVKVDAGFYYVIKDGNLIRFKPNRLPKSIQNNVYNLLRLWAKQVENSKSENPTFDTKTANYAAGISDKSIPDQLKQLIFFGKHSKSRTNKALRIYTEGDVLYFGDNSISFEQLVAADAFAEQHGVLKNFLQQLYVQVNAITLKDDIEARNIKHNKRSRNIQYKEYTEIKVSDDLSITPVKWDNYTHFLLGTRSKGATVKNERTNEDIPVPVNMHNDTFSVGKDNQSYENPQFENVYFIYDKNVTSEENWNSLSKLDATPIVDENDGRAAEVAGINLELEEGMEIDRTTEEMVDEELSMREKMDSEASKEDDYTSLLDLKDSKKEADGPKRKRERKSKIDTKGPTEQQIKEETERYSISYDKGRWDPANFEPMLKIHLEEWKKKNFGISDNTSDDGAAMTAKNIEDYQLMDLYGEYQEFVKMVPTDKFGNPIFRVRTVQGLVNGSDWGYFKKTGEILLSSEAIRGAIFHETFHGITYKLLSKAQRTELYNEVKGLKGKATTYLGETKNLSEFTDIEADEWLAEEFRQYALNKGDYIIGSRVKQSIIQKLFNFLYKFFKGLDTSKALFKRIQTGYYNSGIENYVTYNVSEALEGRSGAAFSKRVKVRARVDLNKGITVALGNKIANSKKMGFETLIAVKNTPEAISKMLKPLYGGPGQINTVYSELHDTLVPQYNTLADRNSDLIDIEASRALTQEEEIEFRNSEKDLDNIEEMLSILENDWSNLVNVNLKFLEKYRLGSESIGIDSLIEKGVEETELSKDTLGIKPANEINLKDAIEPGIKLLLGTLPQASTIKGKSVLKVNSSGVYNVADYNNIANTLYKKLSNKSTIEEIVSELQELSKENKTYQVLLDRLHISQGIDNFSNFNFERMKLLVGFLNTFNTTSEKYVMMMANEVKSNEQPGRYFVNSNTDRAENIIKNAWNYGFKNKLYTYLGKINSDGKRVLDLNKEAKIGNQKKTIKSWINTPLDIRLTLSLLGGIGLQYSNLNKLIKRFENNTAEAEDFLNNSRWIFSELIKKEGDLSSILGGDVEGNLKSLIEYETETTDLAVTLQHITPLNKTVFGVTRKSYLNILIDKLNANDAEINRLMESPYMKGSLYNKERIIKTRTLEGGKNRNESKGFDISKTTKGNISLIHINSILEGFVPLLRVGNKKQEKSVQIGYNKERTGEEVSQYLKDLLLDEIITANRIKTNENLQQISQLNKKGKRLQFFNDSTAFPAITTRAEEFINNGGAKILRDSRKLLEFINSEEVNDNIKEFLNKQRNDNYNLLMETGLISKSPKGYNNVGIDNTHIPGGERNGEISLENIKKVVQKLTHTQLINEIEQTRLFLGHPALYSDIFKRTSGMVGTKVYPSYNPSILSWMNENMPNLITKSKHTGTVRFVTRKEIIKPSENLLDYISRLTALDETAVAKTVRSRYSKMEVFDGGGFINLDFYRKVLFLTNNWSQPHERSYQKIVNNIPLNENDIALFPPIKPQVFADYYADNFDGLNLKVFNKFALFPIHPALSKVVGMENQITDIDNIHDDMIKKGLDYMVFESGTKVGAKTNSKGNFEAFYTKEGQYNYLSDASSIQSYDLEFFGMQLDPKMKVERKVRIGTQGGILTLMDIFQNGMVNPNLGDRFDEERSWRDVANNYNNIHKSLIEKDIATLAKKLGFIKAQDGFIPIGEIQREKMLETILFELDARETSESVKDAVNYLFSQAITYTNQIANKQKLDNLLYSVVTNTVINRKTNGSLSVLQADIGFSIPGSQIKTDVNLPTGMRPLKFYTFEENSVTLNAMEVYLPHYLKEEYGKKLNIEEFDEEALKIIGFGMPTEGLNSIDFIKVAGFLPHNAGANIIVPHELVAKTGKDFDIDKFTLYLPNIHRNQDGIVELVKPIRTPEELLITDPRAYEATASKLFGTDTEGFVSFIETLTATKTEPGPKAGVVLNDLNTQLIELGFNELPDVFKQPTAVIQNELIKSMTEILKHPANFAKLIAPIGSFNLSELAHKIHDAQVDANIDGVSREGGTLFEQFSIRNLIKTTYQMYQTIGGTGIVAKSITHHTKSQKANLKLNMTTGAFNFQGLPTQEEAKSISLALVNDFYGNNISKSLQEYITAYVDGEKDPFIMYVNGGQSGAAVHMLLLRVGVPQSVVLKFMSQPIIHKYFELKNNQSIALATSALSKTPSESLIKESLSKIVGPVPTNTTQFTEEQLNEMLVTNLDAMPAAHKEHQAQILEDFLRYKKQGEMLRKAQETTGQDTDELKNGYNLIYLNALKEAIKEEGYFENLENITEPNSYMGTLELLFEDAPVIFRNMDLKENIPSIKLHMQKVAKELILNDTPKDDVIYHLQQFDNFITSAIWQANANNEGIILNSKTKELFQGENSLPKLINKAKRDYPDNLLIQDLLPQIQEFTDPSNFDYTIDKLRLISNKYGIDEIDNLSNAWEELYLSEGASQVLAEAILDYSIIKSGTQSHPTAFFQALPGTAIINRTKVLFETAYQLDSKLKIENLYADFLDNSWDNSRIVPSRYAGKSDMKAKAASKTFKTYKFNHPRVLLVVPREGASRKGIAGQIGDTYYKVYFKKIAEEETKNGMLITYQRGIKKGLYGHLKEPLTDKSIIESNNYQFGRDKLNLSESIINQIKSKNKTLINFPEIVNDKVTEGIKILPDGTQIELTNIMQTNLKGLSKSVNFSTFGVSNLTELKAKIAQKEGHKNWSEFLQSPKNEMFKANRSLRNFFEIKILDASTNAYTTPKVNDTSTYSPTSINDLKDNHNPCEGS
tara:strand:- start:6155 stop:19723 length:13569 start_codon:yes stop_codon:yes gene_type:complete